MTSLSGDVFSLEERGDRFGRAVGVTIHTYRCGSKGREEPTMGLFKNKDQKAVKQGNKALCGPCRKGGTNCAGCKNLNRKEGRCCCGTRVVKWF